MKNEWGLPVMSRQYSDYELGQISLFFGMVLGAVLTVLLPGPAKLVYLQFQLMCTIPLLLSLLPPKKILGSIDHNPLSRS